MKIVIIAEGGKQLGMGHIMRMSRLATALRSEVTPLFVMRTYSAPASSDLGAAFVRQQGFAVVQVASTQAMRAIHEYQPACIVIDSYDWCGYDIAALATLAPVVLFDDDAPIQTQTGLTTVQTLIAQCTPAVRQRLDIIRPGFMQPFPATLAVRSVAGPEYCLLAPEYFHQPPLPAERKLLVTFGSTDPERVTEQVLSALIAMQLPTIIVIGPAFPKSVASYQQRYPQPWLTFSPPVPSLYPLLAQVTHVLSSGSTTMYEVLATGRNLATIACVENQIAGAQAVATAKQSHHFGWFANLTTADLQDLLESFWQRPIQPTVLASRQAARLIAELFKK